MSNFSPEELLLEALKSRCEGKRIKVDRQRKFRLCKSVDNEGDLDLDMSYALRYTFEGGETLDASIYDVVTVESEGQSISGQSGSSSNPSSSMSGT